jgi:urease accessory protein
MRLKTIIGLMAVLLLAPLVSAHPGHGNSGFAAGISHPLTGLDHLLAIVAVGLLATRLGGRAQWLIPLAFVAFMVGGAGIARAHMRVPAVEQMIAASVVAAGALVMAARRVAPWIASLSIAFFAVFHGYAHGAEMTGSTAAAFTAGFAASTLALLTFGLICGWLLKETRDGLSPVRRNWAPLCGAAIASCGLLLWSGAL